MNRIYINWREYGLLIEELIKQIKVDIPNLRECFDGVYGVPRGGWIVAVALSHNLCLPVLMRPTTNTLVCDDLSDTGKTLTNVKHKKIACLYTTPWTKVKPDYFVSTKKDKNQWLIFPYENIDKEGVQ